MRRLTTILVIVGALALASILVGCGGSSSAGSSSSSSSGSEPSTSAFTAAYKAKKVQLRALGKAVGTAVGDAAHRTDAQITDEFKALAARATSLAGSLGELEAPTKYKGELGALQSSLTQVAGTLHAIEAAAAAHDAGAAKAGGEAIVAEAQQVKSADNGLSAKLGLPINP